MQHCQTGMQTANIIKSPKLSISYHIINPLYFVALNMCVKSFVAACIAFFRDLYVLYKVGFYEFFWAFMYLFVNRKTKEIKEENILITGTGILKWTNRSRTNVIFVVSTDELVIIRITDSQIALLLPVPVHDFYVHCRKRYR